MHKYLIIKLLIPVLFATLCHLELNAQDVHFSGKVKRLVKKIARNEVLMIGEMANYLDARYEYYQNGERFNRLEPRRPNVTRINSMYDRQQYNISFNQYRLYDGRREFQVRYFRDLTNFAREDELIALTQHEKPVIRCYAFWALLEQHYEDAFELLKEHLTDNEEVIVFGDVDAHSHKVGDFYIYLMTQDKIDPFVRKLSEKEQEKLNEMLMTNSDIELEAKRDLIMTFEEDNIEDIRAFAQKSMDGNVIARLAKYKQDEDAELIENLFELQGDDPYHALKASRNFPHPDFLDNLLEFHQAQLKKKHGLDELSLLYLYQALIQYPEEAVFKQLEAALNHKKQYLAEVHQKFIWLALKKYPASFFNKIKNQIVLDGRDKREVLKFMEY